MVNVKTTVALRPMTLMYTFIKAVDSQSVIPVVDG